MKNLLAELGNKDPLEKCLILINFSLFENINVRLAIVENKFDVFEIVINPFTKHINENLLKYETRQGKVDYLKYVVFQFIELQYYWKSNDELLFGNQGTLSQEKTDSSQNIEFAWEIFNIIMNEIQIVSHTFNLDFFKICDELHFSTDTFDSGLTIALQDQIKKLPEKNTRSFSWVASQAQKEALYEALIDHGYIGNGTTKEAFTAIFSKSDIDINLNRVTWIKRCRNRSTNKLALIDLLTLMEIPKSEIEDNDKIKACFSDTKGNPIAFSQANLNGNKSNDHSEFYSELSAIIKSL